MIHLKIVIDETSPVTWNHPGIQYTILYFFHCVSIFYHQVAFSHHLSCRLRQQLLKFSIFMLLKAFNQKIRM